MGFIKFKYKQMSFGVNLVSSDQPVYPKSKISSAMYVI